MTIATPTFRAAGTAVFSANNVANPTTLAPTKNASTVTGDLMVLVTESRSITATVSTPSGWTLVSGFPKRSATASGGSIYIFVRLADGTASDAPSVRWSGVTTGTTGDSCGARILSYSSATPNADGTPPAANDASSTTSITIPAHTTSLTNSLVIGVAIRINDTAHTFTVATFTERYDGHTTSGTGHGTVVAEKINAAAGSSGTATVTPSKTTASRTLAVSFGLAAIDVQAGDGSISGTATATGVGASTASADASVAGVATVSGAGASIASAAGSISGVLTMTGEGSAASTGVIVSADGYVAASSSVNGAGAATASADASIAAVATVTGVGADGSGPIIVAASGYIAASAGVQGEGAATAGADGQISATSFMVGYTSTDQPVRPVAGGARPRRHQRIVSRDDEDLLDIIALLAPVIGSEGGAAWLR